MSSAQAPCRRGPRGRCVPSPRCPMNRDGRGNRTRCPAAASASPCVGPAQPPQPRSPAALHGRSTARAAVHGRALVRRVAPSVAAGQQPCPPHVPSEAGVTCFHETGEGLALGHRQVAGVLASETPFPLVSFILNALELGILFQIRTVTRFPCRARLFLDWTVLLGKLQQRVTATLYDNLSPPNAFLTCLQRRLGDGYN